MTERFTVTAKLVANQQVKLGADHLRGQANSHAVFDFTDDCATARRIAASEVSLPIHPYLTNEEVGAPRGPLSRLS